MKTIGIADTMFARADMGGIAIKAMEKEIAQKGYGARIERYTVPGIKDLPAAGIRLFSEKKCDLVVALGFVGGAEIDETCAHEASQGLINVEIMIGKHILKVFVHTSEAENDAQLAEILRDRVEKHAINALDMVFRPDSLIERAGTGQRQGAQNEVSLGL